MPVKCLLLGKTFGICQSDKAGLTADNKDCGYPPGCYVMYFIQIVLVVTVTFVFYYTLLNRIHGIIFQFLSGLSNRALHILSIS